MDGLHDALRRILSLAGAYEAHRATPDAAAISLDDEELLRRFVALVQAHTPAAAVPPRDQRLEPLTEALIDLLAGAPPRPALTSALQDLCAAFALTPSNTLMNDLLDDLTPGAVASVGGPHEAARRVAYRLLEAEGGLRAT